MILYKLYTGQGEYSDYYESTIGIFDILPLVLNEVSKIKPGESDAIHVMVEKYNLNSTEKLDWTYEELKILFPQDEKITLKYWNEQMQLEPYKRSIYHQKSLIIKIIEEIGYRCDECNKYGNECQCICDNCKENIYECDCEYDCGGD